MQHPSSLSLTVFSAILLFLLVPMALAGSSNYELLNLTNSERARYGLPALRLSSQLSLAAQRHANDMARNNYFSHTGRNGSSISYRAKKAGYAFSYVGENIYAGLNTPQQVIDGWMRSSGHRANILKRHYQEVGFGYAYNPNSRYKHYWVQVFGASKGSYRPRERVNNGARRSCQGFECLQPRNRANSNSRRVCPNRR